VPWCLDLSPRQLGPDSDLGARATAFKSFLRLCCCGSDIQMVATRFKAKVHMASLVSPPLHMGYRPITSTKQRGVWNHKMCYG
jgi:hypothetical protein